MLYQIFIYSASLTDTKKLWKNIEPHLKKALSTLYLREVSSSQWERYQQELEASDNVTLQGTQIVTEGDTVFMFLHELMIIVCISDMF